MVTFCRGETNPLIKRCQLGIQFVDRLLQHLAMTRIRGCLQLLRQPLPRKKQPFALTIAVLLFGRNRNARRLSLFGSLFLLLFYGLALPTPGHSNDFTLQNGETNNEAHERSYHHSTARSGLVKLCTPEDLRSRKTVFAVCSY